MLTKNELAKVLNCSERTIDNWRKEGMPCIKKGNYVRFEEEKVIEWLKESDKKEGK